MLDIQLAGSLSLIGAFIASEAAARLLDIYPGSHLAWRLNMEWFGAFEVARTSLSPARFLFGPASLPVAILLVLVVVFVRTVRSRFAIALFANLSFLVSLMLAYGILDCKLNHQFKQFAKIPFILDTGLVLVAAVMTVSFVGCLASHWSFANAIYAAPSVPKRGHHRSLERLKCVIGIALPARLGLRQDQGAARSVGRSPDRTRRRFSTMKGFPG